MGWTRPTWTPILASGTLAVISLVRCVILKARSKSSAAACSEGLRRSDLMASSTSHLQSGASVRARRLHGGRGCRWWSFDDFPDVIVRTGSSGSRKTWTSLTRPKRLWQIAHDVLVGAHQKKTQVIGSGPVPLERRAMQGRLGANVGDVINLLTWPRNRR